MTARTHDLAAFASLVTLAVYFPPQNLTITTAFVSLVGCVVGALVPDLDQATNRLWDLLPVGNLVGKLFRNLLLQHRTISHSLLGVYLFNLFLHFLIPRLFNPAYVDFQIIIYSLLIGLVSHLVADSLTKEGIPLFFPLPVKLGIPPFKSLRITTGKLFENLIIFPGLTVYLLWFIILKKDILLTLVRSIHS
jgi:membrane-bound metal-dependent hydrolase YbcI (DUF457 family)